MCGKGVSIPWNQNVRFHIVWDQHLFQTNHLPLSLWIAFPAGHNWLYNPASSIILTADPCLMAMPGLTTPQAFDFCTLSCLIRQLKMIYKWLSQCNRGSGRKCSTCCNIKNACPSTVSFAAVFNPILIFFVHFFWLNFIIVPSKSGISGNNSGDALPILGSESFFLGMKRRKGCLEIWSS